MKLKTAIELGAVCGLLSVEDSISNVELHYSSLFKFTELDSEFQELYYEYVAWKCGKLELDVKLIQVQAIKVFDESYSKYMEEHADDIIDLEDTAGLAGN